MLGALSLAAVVAFAPVPVANAATFCTSLQIQTGTCSGGEPRNTGTGIDISAHIDLGSGGPSRTPQINGGGTAAPIGNWPPAAAPPVPQYEPPPPDEADAPIVCLDDVGTVVGVDCGELPPEPEPEETREPEPEPPAPPAVVTISDIASFVPEPPSVATEPDGIAAKSMPLNTIASASEQTVGGELFGFPVSVTFTPAGFRQDWGDGTVTESRHGGSRWQQLQQAEFTPTDTSHAYATKGTYTLTVTALYTAVVDFGPWGTRAVDGVISATAAAREIRVVEVHTALVEHDCDEDPAGVGCPA